MRTKNLLLEKTLKAINEAAPGNWQVQRLADGAICIKDELPPEHKEVIGWVSDIQVAIYCFPVIVCRNGIRYWAGLPGSWMAFQEKRWTLTHWKEIV